jgi:hypothetical protein
MDSTQVFAQSATVPIIQPNILELTIQSFHQTNLKKFPMTAKLFHVLEEKPSRQLISIGTAEDLDIDKCIDTHWFNSGMHMCSTEEIKAEPYFYYELEAPLSWFTSAEFRDLLKQGHLGLCRSPLCLVEKRKDRLRLCFCCASKWKVGT